MHVEVIEEDISATSLKMEVRVRVLTEDQDTRVDKHSVKMDRMIRGKQILM